jgi:hypothetical protein
MNPSTTTVDEQWRLAFYETVNQHEIAGPLRDASLKEDYRAWTTALTAVVVATCSSIGWRASAKGHRAELLPVSRGEYLGMDAMAFAGGEGRWRFPTAVFELENSATDDVVAYSLWKVLSVRADLRVVFCYRPSPQDGPALVRLLKNDVVHAMGIEGRVALVGETLLVVGSRDNAASFPDGFFKWWKLDTNTGVFRVM